MNPDEDVSTFRLRSSARIVNRNNDLVAKAPDEQVDAPLFSIAMH